MITFHILHRGTGKTLGCRNYLRDNPNSMFLLGDSRPGIQWLFLRHLRADEQTNSIRGHHHHSTFVLDELTCYSYDRQDYIAQYADLYNFIIYTDASTFTSDLSPCLRAYVYAHNPEYLL